MELGCCGKLFTGLLFYLAVYTCGVYSQVFEGKPWAFKGTTPYLKEIFIGKCWKYLVLARQNQIPQLTYDVNCTQVWEEFERAVAFKHPCDVKKSDFAPMFKLLARRNSLENRTMFWSGSYEVSRSLRCVTTDYIALEDTLPGYLFDRLKWCGSNTSEDGWNYEKCKREKCNTLSRDFWTLASEDFTRSAKGRAQVLLNATRGAGAKPYHDKSFFRTVEVPVMNVSHLTIFVVSNIDKPPDEKCGTGSLLQLEMDVRSKGAEVDCIEDPERVLNVLCIKHPNADPCKRILASAINTMPLNQQSSSDQWMPIGIVFLVLTVLLTAAIFLLVRSTKKQRMRGQQSTRSTRPMINGDYTAACNDEHNTQKQEGTEGWV